MTVLRAISLAAVTILVCSTREKPSSWANLRTAWRARTMSCSVLRGSTSVFVIDGIVVSLLLVAGGHGGTQDAHAPLDVEGGLDAGQREAQLDERDRDGRLHADQDGGRVEDAGHARDVGDHAADERVDHLQGGDV